QPEEIEQKAGAKKLAGFASGIRFEDVSFRYPTASGLQLANVSLDIRAGEVVALVGSSGAGKTTLAGMVPRFRDVKAGAGVVDGGGGCGLGLPSLRGKNSRGA